MFACLVAGELVQTDCVQVSDNQFAFGLQKANGIHSLAVFLTGSQPFNDGTGGIVYFSWPPYDHWQVLGFLSNEKPSAIFAVRQSSQLSSQLSTSFSYQNTWQTEQQQLECTAQVGIEITDLDSIIHQFGNRSADETLSPQNLDYFCKKMTESFFNYGESFLKPMQDEEGTIESAVPARVFEKWYSNFQDKLRNNPNFWKD